MYISLRWKNIGPCDGRGTTVRRMGKGKCAQNFEVQ